MTIDEFRRKFRSSSDRQCEFLDACFGVGKYAGAYKAGRTLLPLGGGAGFGGKSYTFRTGLIECAMRLAKAGVKSPRQIVFRKTATDLQESHIDAIAAGRDTNAITGEPNGLDLFGELSLTKFNYYIFKFSNKALGTVEFRHAQNLIRRRGAEYDYGWIDELTQFTREEWDAVRYMIRSSKNPPFVGLAGATNPDGDGNAWVKKLWVDRIHTDEVGLDPSQFVFVPFFFNDNPAADEAAEANLLSQSELLRRARYYGEWDLLTGTRFNTYSDRVHLFDWDFFMDYYAHGFKEDIPSPEVLIRSGLFHVYGSLDYGTSADSASAYYLHLVDQGRKVWTFAELYMQGMTLRDQAEAILKFEDGLNVRLRWCDPSLRGTGDEVRGKSRLMLFHQFGVKLVPSINDRISGWSQLENMLYWAGDPNAAGTPGAYIAPQWRIHKNCRQLAKFLRNATRDQNRPEDVSATFKNDHPGDSVRYFFMGYFGHPTSDNIRKLATTKLPQENGQEAQQATGPAWI